MLREKADDQRQTTNGEQPSLIAGPSHRLGARGSCLPENIVGGRPRSPALNRHRFERIIELSAAVTANAICSSANGEDAAEIAVMTPKQEIDQRGNLHRSHRLDGLWASLLPGTVHV